MTGRELSGRGSNAVLGSDLLDLTMGRAGEGGGAMEPRSMVLPEPSALSSSCVFSPLHSKPSDAVAIAYPTSASLTLPHHASATMIHP